MIVSLQSQRKIDKCTWYSFCFVWGSKNSYKCSWSPGFSPFLTVAYISLIWVCSFVFLLAFLLLPKLGTYGSKWTAKKIWVQYSTTWTRGHTACNHAATWGMHWWSIISVFVLTFSFFIFSKSHPIGSGYKIMGWVFNKF